MAYIQQGTKMWDTVSKKIITAGGIQSIGGGLMGQDFSSQYIPYANQDIPTLVAPVTPAQNVEPTVQAAGFKELTKYGQELTLSSGQRISPQDPNYATYAKQMGITPTAGTPRSVAPTGQRILNEEDLQGKRNELTAAGVSQSEWNKYISSPDAQGNLYWTQPATLTSPTGEKKVVAVGSEEANTLLEQNYTLGDKLGGGTALTSDALKDITPIDTGTETTIGSSLADEGFSSAETEIKSFKEKIKEMEELLKTPESDLSSQVSSLLGEAEIAAGELTGRGDMQLSEEEKRNIENKKTAMATTAKELEKKLAAIKTLTASFQLENQSEEGRPQTLSRLQGAQARNYKMFLAQKNLLVSEASYLEADLLGQQGEIKAAQDAANRAVDLEYQDRQAEFDAKINQLKILQPQLEGEEAKYATALGLVLQQQADALAEEKAVKKQQTDYTLQQMAKYPDAGINLNDSYTSINSKIQTSRIFQKATRIAPTGKTPSTFKFSSNDNGRLLAANFTSSDITGIQSDINEFGIDKTVEGMSEDQATAIRNIASGVTPTQESSVSADKRKVIGGVNALMLDNASMDEINEYIILKGYTKADFADLLIGYTPTVSEKKWYQFWK